MRYIVIETNIDRKVPPDDRPSNLPAMEQDHAEHVASALNSRLGWDATRWWVARPETAIAAPAPTDTRANFEAHFQLTTRQAWQHPDGGYKLPEIQAKWEGYQAGVAKAAPVAAPTAYLATDLDGHGDVAFTKAEAQKRAGEHCAHIVPLYAAPVAAAAPGEGK